MLRLIANIVLALGANLVGLIIADVILDDLSIEWEVYLFVVAFLTLVEVIVGPLVTKVAITSVPALRGGIALVTTFVGLVLTDLIFDGFSITGVATWIAATVIVWLGGLIGSLLLPLVLFRKVLGRDQRTAAQPQGGTWAP